MGFKWQGHYYFDKCLPMGCASSCRLFSMFSNATLYALNKLGVKILDDFLFVELLQNKCQSSLDIFLRLCSESCIPTAPHKTIGPDTCMGFLGVELDSLEMMARLLRDKLVRYGEHIDSIIKQKKITLRELQSVIGQLQYVTCVVTPGNAFLRRLINLTVGHSKPHFFLPLKPAVVSDLKTWKHFLDNYNGKSFLYKPSTANSNRINIFSDASNLGFGATYGSNWIQGRWPENWKELHITILETYPLLALVYTFGNKLRNSCIKFYCDNKAVVDIVNKQSSKDPLIMALIRPLVFKMLQFNICFQAEHLPGVNNVLSQTEFLGFRLVRSC